MVDILTPSQRSALMARIRRSDTKPELLVRSALHRLGFRFRKDDRRLPGAPDLVFSKHRAVILVHGCFWHGHDCSLFRMPGTRTEFWAAKIARNRERDKTVIRALRKNGWRILTIWECAMRAKPIQDKEAVIGRAAVWLIRGEGDKTIRGRKKRN